MHHRHDLLPITKALAGRWLAHFQVALDEAIADEGARAALFEKTRSFARTLVNEEGAPSPLRAKPHGMCLRYAPAADALVLARRGDTAALARLLRSSPDILRSKTHAAALVHVAIVGGRRETAAMLVDQGVDVNLPSPAHPLIFLTPLATARWKRRREIEAFLVARGAKEDVFSDAFLGDVVRLRESLSKAPLLAQAIDPAVDALAITPVHHAVAGEQAEALVALLDAVTDTPIVSGERALRDAAAMSSATMVRLLLDRRVDASSIGAGRWVLHAEIAPMITAAGGCVDRSGGWIGLACTGNQGRKDDPAFVEALLVHGARADDKRLVGQGADGGHATALHYAAKAGFVATIAVLLAIGADPRARDDNGETPFDWLDRAVKSIDRASVRHALEMRPSLDRGRRAR